MHINIAELFSKTVTDVKVSRELIMKTISFGDESFEVTEPIKIELDLTKLGRDDYLVRGIVTATLIIPCGRCMKDVNEKVEANFSKELKLGRTEDEEDADFQEYLVGSILDLEKLVLDEVYMNVPMKVLCSDDCLGLCKSCGVNLNNKTCQCEDDNVDPRLAGLKDLFEKQFKEV